MQLFWYLSHSQIGYFTESLTVQLHTGHVPSLFQIIANKLQMSHLVSDGRHSTSSSSLIVRKRFAFFFYFGPLSIVFNDSDRK